MMDSSRTHCHSSWGRTVPNTLERPWDEDWKIAPGLADGVIFARAIAVLWCSCTYVCCGGKERLGNRERCRKLSCKMFSPGRRRGVEGWLKRRARKTHSVTLWSAEQGSWLETTGRPLWLNTESNFLTISVLQKWAGLPPEGPSSWLLEVPKNSPNVIFKKE